MNSPHFRIVLEDHLLPVQAYLNAIPDDIFLRALEELASGIGGDYNGVGYVLPWEDDESAPESGILFYVPKEQVVISNSEMLRHLGEAVSAYLRLHPEDQVVAKDLMARIAAKFPD